MRQAKLWLAICVSMLMSLPAMAERNTVTAYFFGNSLVDHPSETPETSTVFWLNYIAKATGKTLRSDGTWVFLQDMSGKLPPQAEWSTPGVRSVWRGDASAYDAMILTPTNFIQYLRPDQPFDEGNPNGLTALGAAKQAFDYAGEDTRLFVYEGWADMGVVIGTYPPSKRQLRKYHRANAGDYHDWYVQFVEGLGEIYPSNPPKLIPIASTLAQIYDLPELDGLTGTDLYLHDAPHGTPTTYFLAAMVTYASLYDAAPPAALVLPSTIHPLVRANYTEIAEIVARATGTELAALNGVGPQRGSGHPALAMGLDGIHDWSPQYPFLNVMKTARPWLGHVAGQFGGFEPARLEEEGYLDEHGWPMELPEGVEKLESYLLTDLPREAQYFAGRYRLTYEGSGTLRVGGRARSASYGDNEVSFTFSPGEGPVAISILKTDPTDHIRNIAIVHEDHTELYDMGVTFNPLWVSLIRDVRVVRFMDWMITNGSFVSEWRNRPVPQDYTYARRGVPVEVMVDLANFIGADPWFTMPHAADDAYVEAFATYVRDNLDTRRKAYVEYSNEMWNFLFEQSRWAIEQAQARWGQDGDAWMQWTGWRAAQIMGVWTRVFGGNDRLVRVASVHTGWPGLENALLEAPLAVAEGNPRPVESFDAYAVTGYFGIDGDDTEMPGRILRWDRQGVVTEKLTDYLREGPLKRQLTETFPYHAKVADRYGLRLIMYEGGTHIVGLNEWVENEDLTRIYTTYNYSPQMGELYAELLRGWQDAGGVLFNGFVDVAKPSKWGSWGARRHLTDDSVRWRALMEYNRTAPADWEDRAENAFDDGVFLPGDDSDQELIGTIWGDILMGRGGDDRVIASGGPDVIHGGEGTDVAVLPGVSDDYALSLWGDTWLATGPDGEIALRGVEVLEFAGEPGVRLEIGF